MPIVARPRQETRGALKQYPVERGEARLAVVAVVRSEKMQDALGPNVLRMRFVGYSTFFQEIVTRQPFQRNQLRLHLGGAFV